MKVKIKVFLSIFVAFMLFFNLTYAVSKEDILSYVNSQKVCGDVGLFNTYKSTFTRLLKQKNLTEDELNNVYSALTTSVGILNSKDVCKVSDLSKLTDKEKSTVVSNLSYGAGIITNAKSYSDEDETTLSSNSNTTSTGTKFNINTNTNTMDIYENGVLVDRVSMESAKMTYTGTNVTYIMYVVVAILVFVVCLIPYIALYKKHTAKTRVIKNILISLMLVSLTTALVIGIFKDKIETALSMLNMIKFETQDVEYKVELNEDKSIKKYPSYGTKYATLSIEKLGINKDVYFGDSEDILNLGIGHTTYSSMPTEKECVIYSSHNKEGYLKNLKNIKLNDEIIVDTDYAKCTYEVKDIKVLKDTEIDKLVNIENTETLILYTCFPFDTSVYSNQRFVVYATIKNVSWK